VFHWNICIQKLRNQSADDKTIADFVLRLTYFNVLPVTQHHNITTIQLMSVISGCSQYVKNKQKDGNVFVYVYQHKK